VLAGERDRARARAADLRRAGDELGLPRFLVWAARGEGLVLAAEGELAAARAVFETALAEHERFQDPFDRARTLLAYGHVLRREHRRREARAVLGDALAEFERLGAGRFSAMTQAELKHVGGRIPVGEHELTASEERVAGLVVDGLSNKQVAAELVVAVSTVEATLTRIYQKLGITSRSQLSRALAEPRSEHTGGLRVGN